LAGESLYQLRSALDHLAFDLVKLNPSGVTLPTNWEKRCDFPLWLTIPQDMIRCGHANPPLPYNCFEKMLPNIPKAAFAFIEGVQPYRSGAGIHNVLRILAQLSNIDKHRHLNPIVYRIAVQESVSNGKLSSTTRVGGMKHGAEIPRFYPRTYDEADPKREFASYVTFDEAVVMHGPSTLETEDVLNVIVQSIKAVIIPAFAKFLQNP
jgi:hypothetical protein